MGLWDNINQFIANGQDRRAWLDDKVSGVVDYYTPPHLRKAARFASEMNPIQGMSDSMSQFAVAANPSATMDDRRRAAANSLAEGLLAVAPAALAARGYMTPVQATMEGLLGGSPATQQIGDDIGRFMADDFGGVGRGAGALRSFDVARKDASNIFGDGTERVRYTDPSSGGTIEAVVRPNGSASVLELEVPEASRGQGVGQALQERVLQDYPVMGGQVSSKAAATTAYRIGRRPYGMPDATLDDVFRMIDENSSVNLISPRSQPVSLPAPRNDAEAMARDILDLRAAGRASEVTDDMMAKADPQYMFNNTPLPMDVASRMARAEEMGADPLAGFYHGTAGGGLVDTTDITAFDPARVGDRWNADDRGFSITSSVQDANYYARPSDPGYGPDGARNDNLRGGAVYPLEDLSQKPYYIKPMDQYQGTIGAWDDRAAGTYEKMDAAGADSARIYSDGVEMRVVMDPTNLRSRFARFDPEFRHLANLSAGIGGLGLLGYVGDQSSNPLQTPRAE
jgi:hypothetical protein